MKHVRSESTEGLFSFLIDIIQSEECSVGVALDEERSIPRLGHLHSDLSGGTAAIGLGSTDEEEAARAARTAQSEEEICRRK